MISKDYVLAGRAKFTIEFPEEYAKKHGLGGHITYRVNASKDGNVFFLAVRNGEHGTFNYLGLLDPDTGIIKTTRKSTLDGEAIAFKLVQHTLRRIFTGESHKIRAAGFEVHHSGICGRCGHVLTTPESLESGIGPECSKALGIARTKRAKDKELQLKLFKPEELAPADEPVKAS